MERDSFVFYKSWADAIDCLPEAEQVRAYRGIVRYACTGEEPEFSGVTAIIFTLARPIIDANTKRFEDGKRGGRPKKPLVKPLVKPNVSVYVSENENESVNANVSVSENEKIIKPLDNSLFGRFWEAYPKKVNKEAARKAFRKINPKEEDVDTWLRAIEAQKQTRQWQDPQFIPYPATWLNGKRWEDAAVPAQTFVSGDLPF